MSSKNSALASLTATYTDSENEEENSDENSPGTESSTESQAIIPPSRSSYTPTRNSPEQQQQQFAEPQKPVSNKALRLVSYNDDMVVSDDENVSPNRETISMDISEEDEPEAVAEPPKEISTDKYSHYGFTLPPEPKGKVPAELNDKILHFYEKMRTANMDMNKVIQERKEFRNPSIYEKLIHFCDINEFGTNYPPEIYDPLQWGAESFYEELAKSQKVEMLKRQKERKENDKTDQVSAAKKAEEDAKKRKSKWDQPAPTVQAAVKSNIPPPTLTSNVTGTKGTVISAFGSLPKKMSM